ncbi:MAG: YlzJ-like family protein [Methylocystaceae bacterium]
MIIYHPDPLSLLTAEEEGGACWEHLLPSGGRVTLQAVSTHQARVIGISSTNPRDYLSKLWQPGNIINMTIG